MRPGQEPCCYSFTIFIEYTYYVLRISFSLLVVNNNNNNINKMI